MRIRDVLRTKGSAVVTVRPDISIQEAMRSLVQHGIGALVVFDDGIRGILTERDLLRWGGADIHRLLDACVSDVMTTSVITAIPEDEIEQVMDIMVERRIRHLPILEDGLLAGLISIGDVVNAMRHDAEVENRFLHAYIQGNHYQQ